MPQTIEITLYRFSELPPIAQEKAIDDFRATDTFDPWADEWRGTLDAFCSATGIRVSDWEISTCSPSFAYLDRCTLPVNACDLRGNRLRTWIVNNWGHFLSIYRMFWGDSNRSRRSRIMLSVCPDLTGFCGDWDITKPLYDFLKNPDESHSLPSLVQSCLDNWVDGWVSDKEYQSTDEYIRESLEANDDSCRYLIDGSLYC